MEITKLRMRMLEDGRPQYKIAEEVGCSPGRLSDYALGRRAIPSHRIYTFCRVLHCNADDLLGYEAIDESLIYES